jgi:hypothetical protein
MSVNPEMMVVNARQLPMPKVTYGNNKIVSVRGGQVFLSIIYPS